MRYIKYLQEGVRCTALCRVRREGVVGGEGDFAGGGGCGVTLGRGSEGGAVVAVEDHVEEL